MELLDNVSKLFGDDLKARLHEGGRLRIAAASFSIYAWEALRDELDQLDSLEFIFTQPAFLPETAVADRLRKERREFHIPKAERERGFFGSEFEIALRNKLTQRAIARECADWIRRKARFRSNKTTSPMQPFACAGTGEGVSTYFPLHGFTTVDLGYERGNAVSNYVHRSDDAAMAQTYLNLFDQIWQDDEKLQDVTQHLCRHIDTVYQENSPERIYFLMLYHIFSEFLDDISEDVLPNQQTGYENTKIWQSLYNFQRDAATGIINKLETYNGCILADSVGLGKTWTALAVIKYYELRNKSVLVLCPKKLAENWTNYNGNYKTNPIAVDRLNYDVLCHTDVQRSTGESLGMRLDKVNWGNYDLVVIDESHNFRNADSYRERETRYDTLLRQIIRDGVRTKVLMLSATPVNNRFSDLKNQLALAYEGEAEQLQSKLKTQSSIDRIFSRAQKAFNEWSQLDPAERTAQAIHERLDFDFFTLLDSVTIARSRKHIQAYYDTTDIGEFPRRREPISVHPPLTTRDDVVSFRDIYQELRRLNLAVYAPVSYILPSQLAKYEALYDTDLQDRGDLKQVDREKSLKALMTTNLLKRLESSVHAFRLTLGRLQEHHTGLLDRIERFESTGEDIAFADSGTGFDEDAEDLPDPNAPGGSGKIRIRLADMDVPSWRADLEADLIIIDALLGEMQKISPADDAKLQHLKTQITSKISSPINPGNRKLIIFTAFADTAKYLYEHIAPQLHSQQHLHSALITGSDHPRSTLDTGHDFQTLLTLFAPLSKGKAALFPNETAEIDVLVATDCISEGQNLQDCDTLINYDIHWNPVRIIQRFGRIDRIGSPNTSIQLVNYWPDISLDEYINLKERVEDRMVIVDLTGSADDNLLQQGQTDMAYRKDQLRKLQDEVIEMEDVKTGVAITDLGLNDFRMDLLGYIKQHGEGDLSRLPNGLHAVTPAQPERGLHPGIIFTLRNRHDGVAGHNRLHPFYLVYMGNDGQVIAQHTEVKRLLDLARGACKNRSEPVPKVYEPFNQRTADGRDMTAASHLLDAAIKAMVQTEEEKDIDSLFSGGATTALNERAQGLDDFELMSFLVIADPV